MASTNDFKEKWALITGASAGIGVALARELAGRGARLVLTARRKERLESLAQELAARGTETRIVVADLNDPEAPGQIFDATEGAGIEIDILINNAGLGQFGPSYKNTIEQELSQIRVNCEATVHLTRLFIPRMVERRCGWIMVLASTASFQPVPYLNTYAATKVFDRFYAESLAAEVARFGVKVTALCPGPTESEFWDVSSTQTPKKRVQTAEEVARLGVAALTRGRRVIIPHVPGRIAAFFVRLVPTRLVTYVIENVTRRAAESRTYVTEKAARRAGESR